MNIKIDVEKTISIDVDISQDAKELIGLWKENSTHDQEFLDINNFKVFCSDTIGGENYNAAKPFFIKINEVLKNLKDDNFKIDYDYLISEFAGVGQ